LKRLIVTGAGGAPALNFIKSLHLAPEPVYVIGADSNEFNLALSAADENHLVPTAADSDYVPVLKDLIRETRADFLFAQPDPEIAVISEYRDELDIRTFLPSRETIRICQDKFLAFECWKRAGMKVPATRLAQSQDDLRLMFNAFGELWLRPTIGAAGRGSLHAKDLESAIDWIEFNKGWGTYTIAEYLSPHSVTWQSIWNQGELVVAQGRRRLSWAFGDRAMSGVTGITAVGVTVSDPILDDIAFKAITAIDPEPHGIFSVDMTYSPDQVPNPTEINIGRFFTTHLFFSQAGLNMPRILLKLAFGEEMPPISRTMSPLPDGLVWIRGMDREPILTNMETIESSISELSLRRIQHGYVDSARA
jgi:carbamoyl-phosphate synthase large subunit